MSGVPKAVRRDIAQLRGDIGRQGDIVYSIFFRLFTQIHCQHVSLNRNAGAFLCFQFVFLGAVSRMIGDSVGLDLIRGQFSCIPRWIQ